MRGKKIVIISYKTLDYKTLLDYNEIII